MVDEIDVAPELGYLRKMFPGGGGPNNPLGIVIKPEQVLGMEFKGKFQRDPKKAADEERYWNEHGLNPEEYHKQHDLINAEHDFSMWVLHYVPETGLFVARGRDIFGDSGIVGLMRNGEVKFIKAYVREEGRNQSLLSYLDVIDDHACFRLIEFSGGLLKPESGLVPAQGRYQLHDYNHMYHGLWSLDSCQPARFPIPDSDADSYW